MMDAARLEAERELKKKKKEQREKAKTNKKVTAKDVNALRNAFCNPKPQTLNPQP
jgi:hypothetical protein